MLTLGLLCAARDNWAHAEVIVSDRNYDPIGKTDTCQEDSQKWTVGADEDELHSVEREYEPCTSITLCASRICNASEIPLKQSLGVMLWIRM